MLSCLCILALAFQTLLLPLVHRPPQMAAADVLPAWVMTSLCRAVPNAALAQPTESDRQPVPGNGMPACPICLSAQIAATFLPPQAIAVPLPCHGIGITFPTPDAPTIATNGVFRPQARDPPLPA